MHGGVAGTDNNSAGSGTRVDASDMATAKALTLANKTIERLSHELQEQSKGHAAAMAVLLEDKKAVS